MIRNIITICFLSLAGPLLCTSPSLAQIPIATQLQDDWLQYQAHNPQEKIFLHPAKTFYLAGEICWFKAYDVDASLHKPVSFSAIAYAELLDKDQHPVLQTRIELQEGKGSGSFRLPVTLPSGNYILRCYTSWMKNFKDDLFFHQQITVVNTFKNAAPVQTARPSHTIRFFPEGGNLVHGLRSRVAFQLTEDTYEPQNVKGFILDQKKDTVGKFQPGARGTGSFLFTPLQGNNYEARIIIGDSIFTEKIPVPYDKGYVMQLSEITGNRLRVAVQTTIRSNNPILYLFVHAGQQLHSVQTAGVTNNEASFYIDKGTLRDGITHFTVFDDEKAPVCERLYFKHPDSLMKIDAKLSNPAYGTRKKAGVLLTTTQAGQAVNANLSLSVFLLDSLQDLPQEDIVSYLLLASELKGNIRSPRYYLEDSSAKAREDLDNLLLTQGWSRFVWEDVLQHKKSYFEFLPETNGPLIAGHLVNRRTGQPAPPAICYLSVPGKSFMFRTSQSRSDGSILFDTKNFHGSRDIVVQTNSQTADSNYRIDVTSPFSGKPTAVDMSPFHISPALEGQLLTRSIDMQADNSYLFKDKHRFVPVAEDDTVAFYGPGDHEYYLDDYTRFQTLEEVMREYVAEVRVRQQSGKFHYFVKNNLFNLFFEDEPLVLIDGVPAFNTGKILAVDPQKIQKVQIVTRKFYTGPLVNDGVVSYRTYEGDLGGYQLDPNAVAIHYEGLQLQQEFYSPVYDEGTPPSTRIPDFRNLLQWTPDIDTGKEGKSATSFYTSDLPGTYVLFVQGITPQGQPGSSIISFTVHTTSP